MALTFRGQTAFVRTGLPEWIPNGWGLDRLVVPMRGQIDGLKAYQDSLTPWSPASDYDGNMFLADAPADDHKQYPTVRLNYLGKRAGIMPPVRHSESTAFRSASSTIFGGVTFAGPYSYTVNIMYNAPQDKASWLSRQKGQNGGADDPTTDPVIVKVVFSDIVGDQIELPANLQARIIDLYFTKIITTETTSTELVPGQYWQNEQVKTLVLTTRIFTLGSPT